MSFRQASIWSSAAFHVLLLAALALLRGPGATEARIETALVKLRLPVEQRNEAGAAPAPQASPLSPARSASPKVEGSPSREPAGAQAVPAGGGYEPELRPSIAGLSAAAGSAGGGGISLPVPSERMAGVQEPGAVTASARMPAPAASPAREPPRASGTSGAAVASAPVPAPRALPDPAELVRELRGVDTAPTPSAPAENAQSEGSVEQELGAGSRTLRSQPAFPFPPELLAEGREADVTVRVRIRPDGSVLSLGILKSSGIPAADSAAERIVRDYLFNAVEGSTIEEGTVTFHFRLRRRYW